jgi:rod shape-determining protein MreD
MRWFLLLLAGVTAIAIEVSLFEHLAVGGVRPDVALALALLVALATRRFEWACLATWMIGLLVDLISGARFGTYTLLFLAASMIAYGLKRVISGESWFGQFLLVGGLGLLVNISEGAVVLLQTRGIGFGMLAAHAAGTALYTALLAPILGWICQPLLNYFRNEATA